MATWKRWLMESLCTFASYTSFILSFMILYSDRNLFPKGGLHMSFTHTCKNAIIRASLSMATSSVWLFSPTRETNFQGCQSSCYCVATWMGSMVVKMLFASLGFSFISSISNSSFTIFLCLAKLCVFPP